MRDVLARALTATGAGVWWRRRNRSRLLVLMYHGVVARPLEVPCWHQLPVAEFERQMAFVAARYRVLPLEDALERMRSGTLPPRSCAITFDDGFRNVRTVAGPVLARHRFPATVFLPTGAMDAREVLWPDRLHLAISGARAPDVDAGALGLGRLPLRTPVERAHATGACAEALKRLPRAEKQARLDALLRSLGAPANDAGDFALLDWDDVAAMQAGGLFSFGPHTVWHEILSRCEDDRVRAEVGGSAAAVARRTGGPARVFAYPNGRPEDFDDRARAAVAAHGMPWALSTIEGLNDPSTDALALRRISVGADLSLARFALLTSGALSALRRAS